MYKVERTTKANRHIKKLDSSARKDIESIIEDLQHNPRPVLISKKLTNQNTYAIRYRVKEVNQRIFYKIDDETKIVYVTAVMKRDDTTHKKMKKRSI